MTTPNFKLTLAPIGHGHTAPPTTFLAILLLWAKAEKEPVFDRNPNFDIYSVVGAKLAPFDTLLRRKAIACEVLRVLGGDESDWDWREGADTTAKLTAPDNLEAGAFQVSFDSHRLGKDLMIFLLQNGITSSQQFRNRVRADPIFDCAYTFRLLRVTTRWDGPINRGWVLEQCKPECVDEWACLLQA